MSFKYLRIQGRENSWVTGYPKGIFSICHRLIMDNKMSKPDAELFLDIDKWFVDNLPEPEPCKNGEKVITFFKTASTAEMQKKIAPAMELLNRYTQPYDVVYTDFVGTIVYEDEWQVAVRVEGGKMI